MSLPSKETFGRACICAQPIAIGLYVITLVLLVLVSPGAYFIASGVFAGATVGALYGYSQGETQTVQRIRSYLHREER